VQTITAAANYLGGKYLTGWPLLCDSGTLPDAPGLYIGVKFFKIVLELTDEHRAEKMERITAPKRRS
jgi:hypothetical protein